jgi:predicted RNase H-like nuclease (RuvC/YqgF family)
MYKSGDSQNFLNATQGVDALVDGFGAGIEAAVQTLQRHAQERQHIDAMNEAASSAQWEQYARRLARENQRLIQNLSNLEKDYTKLERKLNSFQSAFSQYTELLVTRIRKLDEVFQRQSANEFAYNKMRCTLIDKLQQLAHPSVVSLISEEEQYRLLKDDWDYFMEHQDVRIGVPDIAEIFKRRE